MNESGWATKGDNANRVDSGADSCRIVSVNDRSISDSRAVCGDWLRTEQRTRRLFAAVEARTAGYGGIAAASQATGIARSTSAVG